VVLLLPRVVVACHTWHAAGAKIPAALLQMVLPYYAASQQVTLLLLAACLQAEKFELASNRGYLKKKWENPCFIFLKKTVQRLFLTIYHNNRKNKT
jgi:hypothetical protein